MENKEYICRFCGRVCKNANSLRNHERLCKLNPDRQISYGNKGNMPEHTKAYYKTKIKAKNGDQLDITKYELDEYFKTHLTCEICGKTLDECVKWKSKYSPKHFCIDHDHTTSKFRGVLCSVCNRQLGWYEKNKENINSYLNKGSVV